MRPQMLPSVSATLGALQQKLGHESELWRRAMRYGAVRGPDAFVRYSPPLFAWAWAAALPRTRRKVRANLRRAGASGSAAEVAAVFANYALALTEAFAVGSGRNERMNARIVGDSAFASARAHGRGVIVATAHTSGWYAAGPILGSVYRDEVVLVMQEERDSAAQKIQAAQRAEIGMRTVLVGSDPLAAMPLLGHLRKGGIVAVQSDRVPPGQRLAHQGDLISVPEGPVQLAALSGAPIVVVLGRRVGFLEYEVEVTPPIVVARRPSPGEVREVARQIADRVGDFVRRHPTDWFDF